MCGLMLEQRKKDPTGEQSVMISDKPIIGWLWILGKLAAANTSKIHVSLVRGSGLNGCDSPTCYQLLDCMFITDIGSQISGI